MNHTAVTLLGTNPALGFSARSAMAGFQRWQRDACAYDLVPSTTLPPTNISMVTKSNYAHGEFSWVDLVTHDIAAAGAFYSEVFGWSVSKQDTQGGPPYVQFEIEGDPVAGLGEMSAEMKSHGVPPMWNSYVNVDDIKAITGKAVELGAIITVPVMQVTDVGWLSFIMDPGGASVAFWQQGSHCGAARTQEPGTCCWNELATKDVEKSREFYGALLGWEFAEYPGTPSKYYVAKVDGNDVGGLMQMTEEWGEIPSHWGVYFAVEDVDAAVARVNNGGGVARVEPFDTDVGRIAVLGDPQGATFSLLHKSASC